MLTKCSRVLKRQRKKGDVSLHQIGLRGSTIVRNGISLEVFPSYVRFRISSQMPILSSPALSTRVLEKCRSVTMGYPHGVFHLHYHWTLLNYWDETNIDFKMQYRESNDFASTFLRQNPDMAPTDEPLPRPPPNPQPRSLRGRHFPKTFSSWWGSYTLNII